MEGDESGSDTASRVSLIQTLTAIKSKVDSRLKELSSQGGVVSLSGTAAEEGKEKEVLTRLEKALDDLSEIHHAHKVNILLCQSTNLTK